MLSMPLLSTERLVHITREQSAGVAAAAGAAPRRQRVSLLRLIPIKCGPQTLDRVHRCVTLTPSNPVPTGRTWSSEHSRYVRRRCSEVPLCCGSAGPRGRVSALFSLSRLRRAFLSSSPSSYRASNT